MKQTLQFRILSLQVIKRSLVILCMALFANSMSIHAQTINSYLVQDAFWNDAFDPGLAVPTLIMATNYVSETDNSIVTNYVGTSIFPGNENLAQAALKFRLPQSSSVLSKAKLFFKVVDIQGSPTATVTLTDDNNWMQTTDEATSKFPTLSNASVLLTNAPVSSTGWFSLYLPTSALDAKIVHAATTETTLIITGSTAPNTYFNFVADDDASGNKAFLRFTFKPQVQSVSIPANGTYRIGDILNFRVSFDSLINVTGTPKLPITLNTGGTVQASYVAGSGSQELIFRYTVASGDLDMDGVTVGSAIDLNGGTISSDFGEDAELNLYSVGATAGVLVEGTIPTISSVSPPGNATYTAGQNLDYTVNFSKAVNVVTTGGAPYLTLTIGSTTAHATYISGTGTTALVFRHTIVPTDYDVDGIALASNITLNGGTIKDGAGNSATLSFTGSTATGVQIGTAPTVTTVTPSTISSSAATLIGTVNPNNISTTVTFEYGTSTSYGSSTTAIQSPVTGTTATAVSSVIYGLVPNTTYHFRVKGVNTVGTTNGTDLTFTTSAAAPTATSTAASSISGTAATLNGTINAKNASTIVTFEYGLTTSYGTIVTADQSPVTGSTATTVSKAITGLTPGTTYYYRVVGVNAAGTTNGSGKSFTTPLLTGNGTPADPYQIGTLVDLKWVAEHSDIWNSSFVQTADIDASTTSTWNSGNGFSPIGNVTTKFTGSYNGQYHTITGLTISRSDEYNVGLFGVTTNAILKNIALLDCSIIGDHNVGGLVGYMGYNSTLPSSISDCYCTGNVSGTEYVSGLVGVNLRSNITNSYSTCNVTATADAAGLVGSNNDNFAITNCFYDKNISGQSDTGKGTPKTTAEMKTQSTFTGWDFVGETANGTADIWAISGTQNSGYPCFMHQITSPVAPTVTTQAITDIATTTATGNGNITGLGVPNPGSHGVCWGTSANPTIIDNTVANKGVVSATGAFSAPINGLTPNTLYHVRAYATNSTGTVYGDDVSFTTKMPTVTSATTNVATGITATGATLNGSINANNASTTVTFEYGLTTSYGTTVTADQSPVTGSTTTLVSKAITGLTAGTTYHYRVVGVNTNETTTGDDMTFTTLKLLSVTTQAVSSISTNSVVANGNITDLGQPNPTAYGFCWSTSPNPTTDNSKLDKGSISDTGAFSATLTGLATHTKYYVRAYTINEAGTSYGEQVSFSTNGIIANVTLYEIKDIESTSAIGKCSITDLGVPNATAYGICWSTSPNPTMFDSKIHNLGTPTTIGFFYASITELEPNTVYYARVYAANGQGVAYSDEISFKTTKLDPIISWSIPSDIFYGTTLNDLQLNATSNEEGTFEYTPAAGTKLNVGDAQELSVTFTPSDLTKNKIVSKTVRINVRKAVPSITWENPKDIESGTALSNLQLNAVANIDGTFVYRPDAGTILNTGDLQELTVLFSPTDTEHYTATGDTVKINVVINTGIDTEKQSSISLYPNPTTDKFYINGIENQTTVRILSLNGELISEKKIANNEAIPVQNLPAGTYLIGINNKEAMTYFKLVKK